MLHACESTIVSVIFRTRFVLSMPFFITFSQAMRCLLLITAFNLPSLALTVFHSFKGFTFGKEQHCDFDPFWSRCLQQHMPHLTILSWICWSINNSINKMQLIIQMMFRAISSENREKKIFSRKRACVFLEQSGHKKKLPRLWDSRRLCAHPKKMS